MLQEWDQADAWFRMYPVDFLSGTRLMKRDVKGDYITLICQCAVDRGLPCDFDRLAAFCGIKTQEFMKVWPVIRGNFWVFETTKHDETFQFLVNRRLAKEFHRTTVGRLKKLSKSTSDRFASSNRPSATASTRPSTRARTRASGSGSDSNSDSKTGKRVQGKTNAVLPPGCTPEAWDRFCNYRRKKDGKAFTADAESLNLRELVKLHAAGNDPVAVIDQTIARGWSGLFELKQNFQPSRNGRHQQAEQEDTIRYVNPETGGFDS